MKRRSSSSFMKQILSLVFCQHLGNFPCLKTQRNYNNCDKTCMKLFPNFTNIHLITHTTILFYYYHDLCVHQNNERNENIFFVLLQSLVSFDCLLSIPSF